MSHHVRILDPALAILLMSTLLVETSAIPGITGCYQSSNSVEVFLPFILLSVVELGVSLEHIIIHFHRFADSRSSQNF